MSFGLNRKGLNTSPRTRQIIRNKGYFIFFVLPVLSDESQNQHCANTTSGPPTRHYLGAGGKGSSKRICSAAG